MKENIMVTGKQRNNNFGTRPHYQKHISPDFLLQDLPTKSPVSYKLDWVNTVIITEAFTVSSPVYCHHVRTRPSIHESLESYSIYKLYPWISSLYSSVHSRQFWITGNLNDKIVLYHFSINFKMNLYNRIRSIPREQINYFQIFCTHIHIKTKQY